ncbi:CLUMA_CG019131, isoform A [Clunio marinus]|uniref:CLUMA_CG019131, isoform A n=1 Tax=Clunio marinus TaxID=568069 RepID=A0A1J1J1E5_9DIPT|nr:CLUMA_CG019131, isoform A [Clunio marinus]
MKAFIFSLFVLALLSSQVDAQRTCMPGRPSGVMNVCRQRGSTNCSRVESRNTCINLVGGPFVSGFAGQVPRCTIFANEGCRGSEERITSIRANFSFPARSVRCPCV